MKTTQKIGFGLALFVLGLTLLIPPLNGLGQAGWNTIGLTLFFLILLVTEALPLSVSCLFTIGLTPLFGVTANFAGAVAGFAHPVLFFVMASFAIAAAIMNVPITKRILLWLLKRAGNDVRRILFAIMVATGITSFFMSNVPTCAIMMSIALEFVNSLEEGPEKRSIGKAFMIGVPVATMIGGISTPASSSLNLLAIGLLEQHAGVTISFVQWMILAVPLVLVFIPLAWFLIVKVYKPAEISPEKIIAYREAIAEQTKEPIGKKEALVIGIMLLMLGLWISTSWVTAFEIFTVSMLGATLFFLPGVQVLTWKKFLPTMNWDIIFISGVVLTIAGALVTNGVTAWMVDTLYPEHLELSARVLVGFAALIAFVMALVITSAPALITVLAGPFAAIALANGVPPAYLAILLAICAGNCYLFPLDTVQLLTYSKGYYRMTDMCRSTIFLQLGMIVALAFWLPFMGGILGIA